jgi:hypothetical protein
MFKLNYINYNHYPITIFFKPHLLYPLIKISVDLSVRLHPRFSAKAILKGSS